jgi:hypothetical protein
MRKHLFIFVLMAVMLVMVAGCSSDGIVKVNAPVPITKAGTSASKSQITIAGASIQVYAPGTNQLVNTADTRGHISGILIGIWQGVISPVTLVMSFINPNVQMYEVHNDGSQYNLGFLIGVAIVFIVLGALLGSRR